MCGVRLELRSEDVHLPRPVHTPDTWPTVVKMLRNEEMFLPDDVVDTLEEIHTEFCELDLVENDGMHC